MVPPIRWYYIFSTWIFLLSTAYPLHAISTYPLNVLALPGCFEILINPHKEHWTKNLYILALHILPFLWIPYSFSATSIYFAAGSGVCYLVFVGFLEEDPIHIYTELFKENHPTYRAFVSDRFGLEETREN